MRWWGIFPIKEGLGKVSPFFPALYCLEEEALSRGI